ncbi:hypothetical protein FHS37_002581 [Streptomyces griseostramineus]|uniref:Uncharacterized protein n=1 Tax=Streptomyces griseomycini TaxID=66895 RepID=A0A7W7LXZ6_9ACTN|nr:hypothetical protein [Streptomyces griseomycini]
MSGFGSAPTAFTNTRRPSTRRMRAATPGEKPPAWVTALCTGAPRRSSTWLRTPWGTAHQSTRTPAATGALSVFVLGRLPMAT